MHSYCFFDLEIQKMVVLCIGYMKITFVKTVRQPVVVDVVVIISKILLLTFVNRTHHRVTTSLTTSLKVNKIYNNYDIEEKY